jgi:biotin carboxylase
VLEFATEYMHLFNQLVGALTDFEVNGGYFLAESLLHGTQVTVEGYALDGRVEIVGIVDSIMHPGTGSFARFDYPSAMRSEIRERMANIARRAIAGIGLDRAMFNIEMIYEPARDTIRIIEINPRICGQFADLYQKVDGVNGYAIALALAAGDPVPGGTGRGEAAATSFPLRLFRPARVRRAPTAEDVAAAEALYPGTLVWIECEAEQELADFERIEDGQSCRYGIVNVGGSSRAELLARLDAVTDRLGFAFEDVAAS